MRTLRRNKQKLMYALQTSEQTPVYVTDDDGNIKYQGYEDSDGNYIYILDKNGDKIPQTTGEYEYVYTTPVDFYANISFGGNDTTMEVYGVDTSSYDATLLVQRNELPLTETSVVWFDTEPTYLDEDKTVPNWRTADFQVVKKVDSLSFTTFVLKKRTK